MRESTKRCVPFRWEQVTQTPVKEAIGHVAAPTRHNKRKCG